MHQAGGFPALVQDFGDPILLAEVAPLHVFNAQPGGPGREDRMIPDLIAQRLGEDLQIKTAELIAPQPGFHPPA